MKFSIKKYVSENVLPLTLLLVAFGFCCYSAMQRNPDSDALFLIENGRWIIANGGVPKINPWNVTDGMGIIIQQWICSIINYEAYKFLGFNFMWIAAAFMNVCLIFAMGYFCRAFCKNSSINLIAIAITDFFLCAFVNTRPYQITMTISLLMLGTLFRRNKALSRLSSFPERLRHYFITALFCGGFALLQANYQLAFFFMLFAWPLCFVAPKWDEFKPLRTWITKDRKNPWPYFKPMLKGLSERFLGLCMIYAVMFLVGLINPYGLSGLLYLPKSSGAIGVLTGKISEIAPQSMVSIFAIGLIATIVMAAFTLRERLFKAEVFYLMMGGMFLAYGTIRNTWLAYPSFLAMFVTYVNYKDNVIQKVLSFIRTKNGKNIKRISIEFLIVISILAPFILPQKDTNEHVEEIFHSEAVSYMMNLDKDSYKLYTGFNTGAMFEFCGIKVYFDPRPELYATEITGGVNQFKEWYDVTYEDPDKFLPFLKDNGFTHCETDVGGITDYLLKTDPDFIEIARSKAYVLYERADFSDKDK